MVNSYGGRGAHPCQKAAVVTRGGMVTRWAGQYFDGRQYLVIYGRICINLSIDYYLCSFCFLHKSSIYRHGFVYWLHMIYVLSFVVDQMGVNKTMQYIGDAKRFQPITVALISSRKQYRKV